MINYKRTYLYKLLVASIHKIAVKSNPQREMCRVYYKVYNKYPNLENPKNLIEKIYWMQLNTDTSLWTRCADKYAMRQYVKECGCEDFLPLNYGKWDKALDVDFNSLPNEFVLKSNNGCETVLIVKDKLKLDKNATIKKMQRWLRIPYGWSGAELHYTRIKPCIIAEELLHQDEELNIFSPESIVDFKVWCINGEPESILIVYDRNNSGYCLDLYDTEWNRLDNCLKKGGHFIFREIELKKPTCLAEMLDIAKKVAKPFPEVRVDFYIIKGKPVLGELTFTTGYGYFTDEYYNYLGSKIDLNKLINNNK